jgi:hypothetical protein
VFIALATSVVSRGFVSAARLPLFCFNHCVCFIAVGEYNLRLGIIKELRPNLIATYSDVNSNNLNNHYEGHPFVIEAAVALGSHGNPTSSAAKEDEKGKSSKTDNDADGTLNTKDQQNGIHIYRFANRIPLLFETGADVVTQVATKQVNWGSYLIDPKKDHIGVFISIVSTKIPYKGTSKEYIGADITEISRAVKSAIQQCGLQLKIQLNLSLKAKHDYERKRTLSKYIPNICNALYGMLTLMKEDGDAAAVQRAGTGAQLALTASAGGGAGGGAGAVSGAASVTVSDAKGTSPKRGAAGKRGSDQAEAAMVLQTATAAATASGTLGYEEMQRSVKRAKKLHMLKQFDNGE